MDLWDGEARVASLIKTCARFQACFVSFEDFHRILYIYTEFMDFHGFSWISGMILWGSKARPAALIGTFA